jgi:hypothetical protein
MVRTLRSNLDRRNKSTLKKRTRSKNNFNRKSINKRKTNRKKNRKTNRKYNKKYINQKGGDNTYELLREMAGDEFINPSYDQTKAGPQIHRLGDSTKGEVRVRRGRRQAEEFERYKRNLIRGERLKQSNSWKDANRYKCHDWTPEKCKGNRADGSYGGSLRYKYTKTDMDAVRKNCPVTCKFGPGWGSYASGNMPTTGEFADIWLNTRNDYVQPDLDFCGYKGDWPQKYAGDAMVADAEPTAFHSQGLPVATIPHDEVVDGDTNTKVGPAAYLCIYCEDPKLAGKHVYAAGWSDYLYTSLLVSDKDQNCREYSCEYKQPRCELMYYSVIKGRMMEAPSILTDREIRDNSAHQRVPFDKDIADKNQMRNHRFWVLKQKDSQANEATYWNRGSRKMSRERDHRRPPSGSVPLNETQGYIMEDPCTKENYTGHLTEISRTDKKGRKRIIQHHQKATCDGPKATQRETEQCDVFDAGACWTRCRAATHNCKKYYTIPDLPEKKRDDDETDYGGCKYCRVSALSVNESRTRNVCYQSIETRGGSRRQAKFRFAIYLGHLPHSITDLGEETFNKMKDQDKNRISPVTGKNAPIYKGEDIRGPGADDKCLRACVEMMTRLGLTEKWNEIFKKIPAEDGGAGGAEQGGGDSGERLKSSWETMHEPHPSQIKSILSYMVEPGGHPERYFDNTRTWLAQAFGYGEPKHLPEGLEPPSGEMEKETLARDKARFQNQLKGIKVKPDKIPAERDNQAQSDLPES